MPQDIENGGPAFPTTNTEHDGMSLRDWFASRALQALLVSPRPIRIIGREIDRPELFSECAYAIADAMLKARGG